MCQSWCLFLFSNWRYQEVLITANLISRILQAGPLTQVWFHQPQNIVTFSDKHMLCLMYVYICVYNMNIYGSITLYNYRLMRHFARLLFMLPMKRTVMAAAKPQGDDASAARQRFDQLCSERRSQVEAWWARARCTASHEVGLKCLL